MTPPVAGLAPAPADLAAAGLAASAGWERKLTGFGHSPQKRT